ncbi:MAG: hypothetical protein AB8B79_08345 [Granulosicoccus sp.]
MTMNDDQYEFLKQLALRIPRLFEAIDQGNIKSEYIIGLRRIGQRDVRLKLVAEVVDPGPNPLKSHGTRAPQGDEDTMSQRVPGDNRTGAASTRRRARKR